MPELFIGTSWAPVDLGPVLAGEVPDDTPGMLARADGPCLLYPGKLHQVAGEPEACKGWLACLATAERLMAGERTVYFDFEDTEASIVARLRALGVADEALLERFAYVRPHEPLTPANSGELSALLFVEPTLVVVDGVTEALTIHGLDLNNNADIAKWLELLPRVVTRSGAACLLIDHVTKDRESRDRFAIGAQHKLAGIDVAYGLQVVEPFGRGRAGLVKVKVAKDRPGHVRQHAVENLVATMHLASEADVVTVELRAPTAAEVFRPTVLMGRVAEAVAAEPGMTSNGIEKGVKGNAAAKRTALRLLVEEGFIDQRPDGQALRHYAARPFQDGDRVPASQPGPDRVRTQSAETASPRPSPYRGDSGGHGADDEPADQGLRPSCRCKRPAPSPRSGGSAVCAICKQYVEEGQ